MNILIEDNAFYSDDTILIIAILDAILNNKDYDYYLRKYIQEYSDYRPDFTPYFSLSFSYNLIEKWSKSNIVGTSHGNGAMMRISPVGSMFDYEAEVMYGIDSQIIEKVNEKIPQEFVKLLSEARRWSKLKKIKLI